MDIKGIGSNVVTQQQTKNEKPKDESLQSETLTADENSSNSADTVIISSEAKALFDTGGGHPTRPPKNP